MTFSSLGLSSPALLGALTEKGRASPTAVQSAAIEPILQGRDVFALAQTGSGKTAAFVLPLLQRFMARQPSNGGQGARPVSVLILVPTRELAFQVGQEVKAYGANLQQPPKMVMLYGGVSVNPQMLRLRGGADFVVATPGRLLDLVDRNSVVLGNVRTLVLDEADRMLDLGFEAELGRIVALLPRQRQNLLFSATFTRSTELLADAMLHDPVRVEVTSSAEDRPDIAQRAIQVDTPRRTQLLRHLVQTEKWSQALVFVATKHAAETVADKLRKADIQAEPFHGELSQGKRNQVLMDLKAGLVQVVVATDVAARGIDIAGLSAVVNYDLPRSAVDYVHRIGRTGRAGLSGVAVSFITADSEAHFRLIEKRNGVSVVREQLQGFEPTETRQTNPLDIAGTGGVKGLRPSKKDKLRAKAKSAGT